MPTARKPKLSPEEYLAIERKAETKSEYYQGEMFAMAGASFRHGLIASNLANELSNRLEESGCYVIASDLRVRVSPGGLYTYPDVAVICGEPQFADGYNDTLINPSILIEVLSPSTADYDRGRKFGHYRAISSLKEYIVVAQDAPEVEHFARQSDNSWTLTEVKGREAVLRLASRDCEIPLERIYRRVEFNSSDC